MVVSKHTEEYAEYIYHVIHDNPVEFQLGVTESFLATGVTYDGDPWSPRSIAYDYGRTLGEAIYAPENQRDIEEQ